MLNTPARPELPQPFGVVCHDSGAAGQIAAMLIQWGWQPAWIDAQGPAGDIFNRECPDLLARSRPDDIKKVKVILSGTGWSSDIEHQARKAARQAGVRSIAVLDHWTNYKERFIRRGEIVLPDEIWVVDQYAEKFARKLFPNIPILLVTDCFAELQLKRIAPISGATPNRVLYLLEPARSDWGRTEPGEFQALRYFLDHWPCLKFPPTTELMLRPHPSEAPQKYAMFLNKKSKPLVQWSKNSLSEDITQARWVAGCHTYAMALALASSRTVFCTLPPWAPPRKIPHKGIINLREILN